MAQHTDALSILPEPRPAQELWRTLCETLRSHGAIFEPGTVVILNPHEDQDPEPEEARSEEEAIGRIVRWPALGGVRFGFDPQYVTLFTFGQQPHRADAITVSTLSRAYLLESAFTSRFDALVADMHRATQASRTISDFELLSPGSWWIDEVMRVRQGWFKGIYPVDLR